MWRGLGWFFGLFKGPEQPHPFERAMDFTALWEGHYSNDPNDPGGETIYGITKVYHPEAFKRIMALPADEQKPAAREFFHNNYWITARCDEIPWPFSLAVFDAYVNMRKFEVRNLGLGSEAIVCLQRALKINDDGVFGRQTKRELYAIIPEFKPRVFRRMVTERQILYHLKVVAKPIKMRYLAGWFNRCNALHALGAKDL